MNAQQLYQEELDAADALSQRCVDAINVAQAHWYCLGFGRHRAAFLLSDSWVLKVPRVPEGEFDNEREVLHYESGDPHYARCELVQFQGMIALRMEYVTMAFDEEVVQPLPKWVQDIDCQQVGYTRDNRLVAFDFADQPLHREPPRYYNLLLGGSQ
jgi:hypothetical protein